MGFFTENQKISKWKSHKVFDMILTQESLYSNTWNLWCPWILHWQYNLARWHNGKNFPPLPDCQKAFLYNHLWLIHYGSTKKSINHNKTLCYIISSTLISWFTVDSTIQFSTLLSGTLQLLFCPSTVKFQHDIKGFPT